VVERARLALKLASVPKSSQPKRLALLKYGDYDKDTTRELIDALKSANVSCLASNNGLPLIDSLRELPAQALIVVLGQCPPDWLTARGFELLKVQLAFRDQTPLRLYYHADQSQVVPSLNDADVLEFRGAKDLPKLVAAIAATGVAL
jgi:hypothetical protein